MILSVSSFLGHSYMIEKLNNNSWDQISQGGFDGKLISLTLTGKFNNTWHSITPSRRYAKYYVL